MTNKLNLRNIDARTVRLDNTMYLEETDNFGEIIRLYKQNSNIEIQVGSIVKHKRSAHKVNLIVRGVAGNKITCYDLKCASQNTSSIFITPLLGLSRSNLFWKNNFVNAFMSTPAYDVCIALLYRFSGDVEFVKFEAWLKTQSHFVASYDTDNYHTLYVFSVPDIALETYMQIRNGKYSEISELWKLQILSYHGFDREGKTGQILYKDKRLREEMEQKFDVDLQDAELHSIPEMKYERFDPEYYLTQLNSTKQIKSARCDLSNSDEL